MTTVHPHRRDPGGGIEPEPVATLPSPLYGLYRIRDHLSALMITVVFAIFAVGTIAALLGDRFFAARLGRRGVMLSSVATMMIAAGSLALFLRCPACSLAVSSPGWRSVWLRA